jgi:hypothetical protein
MEENEFEKHIREGWNFSQKMVKDALKLEGHVATNVSLAIFEKYISPRYYFVKDTQGDPPTEKQINLAKKLGISKPEQYTKKELSKKLSEALDD